MMLYLWIKRAHVLPNLDHKMILVLHRQVVVLSFKTGGAFVFVAFDMPLRLDVGLNSKERQRQDTDRFRCDLHLLTLRFINNTEVIML